MSTPSSPLHDALPSEIKGLQMQHWYTRCEAPWREASVAFNNNKITVKSTLDGRRMSDTFCKEVCFEVLEPLTEPELSISIRHSCVEGWRLVFKAADEKVLLALKDAFTRVKHDQLLSHNLLMDDRCKLLKLPTRGLSQEQIRRMREETTVSIPKGTAADFAKSKFLSKSIGSFLSLRVVNACPAMRIASSTKHHPEFVNVEDGVLNCIFPRGVSLEIKAADFFPPRVVSPRSDNEQIFVCDSRDKWNARQAWIFATDKAHVARMLETLTHAWMDVGGTTVAENKEKPKGGKGKIGKSVAPNAGGAAKKGGSTKKAATPKRSASKAKAVPKSKTTKKVEKRVAKGQKKPVPKKNASGRVVKKAATPASRSGMRTRSAGKGK